VATLRPSKYDPLIAHLAAQVGDQVGMSFLDVETLLGEPLPPAAYEHAAWWANSVDDPTHSWARRWVAGGWLARVDLGARRVVFRRIAGGAAPMTPPTRLEELQPTTIEPVMDLVERAGVNVADWAFTADGAPVTNARANPNFCYDWSFGSAVEGFVLCLWFDNLEQEKSGRIVSRSDVVPHQRELEKLRGAPGIDGSRRNAINQQLRRARDFEFALDESWRRNKAVRVIINAGVLGGRGEAPSRVDFRELDAQPWYVHGRDDSGMWIIVRAVPPGADDGDEFPPVDEDDSPGADDYRRMASIRVRRGQPKFRADLIGAYGGSCAVTGTRIEALLEAAHIVPHSEQTNFRVSNGLLLRADIHTLYDLHLLSVDDRLKVHLSKRLLVSDYMTLHGKTLKRLPSTTDQQPSTLGLRMRHERFLATEAERTDV
jgi:hypothetical protein